MATTPFTRFPVVQHQLIGATDLALVDFRMQSEPQSRPRLDTNHTTIGTRIPCYINLFTSTLNQCLPLAFCYPLLIMISIPQPLTLYPKRVLFTWPRLLSYLCLMGCEDRWFHSYTSRSSSPLGPLPIYFHFKRILLSSYLSFSFATLFLIIEHFPVVLPQWVYRNLSYFPSS